MRRGESNKLFFFLFSVCQRVDDVNTGGSFHVGDAAELSPKYVAKSAIGSGSFNTGDLPINIFRKI